jgi:hypothetical protein
MKMEHMEDQSVRAFRSRVRSHVLVNDQRLGCPLVNGSTVAKHRSTLDASCRTAFSPYLGPMHVSQPSIPCWNPADSVHSDSILFV